MFNQFFIYFIIRNRDNFGHDRSKMDQHLPYFYTDNFPRDLRVLDKMYFGRSVFAGFTSLCFMIKYVSEGSRNLLIQYIYIQYILPSSNISFYYSIHLSVIPSIYPSFHPSVHHSIHLSVINLSILHTINIFVSFL